LALIVQVGVVVVVNSLRIEGLASVILLFLEAVLAAAAAADDQEKDEAEYSHEESGS